MEFCFACLPLLSDLRCRQTKWNERQLVIVWLNDESVANSEVRDNDMPVGWACPGPKKKLC